MDFYEILDQVIDLLKQRGRASYRALRLQFNLEDEHLEVLKEELINVQQLAVDQDGRMLVWIGEKEMTPESTPASSTAESISLPAQEPEREPLSYTPPHLAEKILTTRSALEGERKQVTVLFCDLQNSTPLAEKIGPENMHSLLNRFFELALSEVHRYEGTINQFLGDGFMAIMGAPIAHEDHARRAVLAAIGLQRRLKETNPGEPYGVECRFRIGINSGLVVVASIGDNLRMDYTAVGDTTNLASRLQTQAEPGEILVSESTARLVEGYIRLEALTPVEVKGKTEPVSTYKVIGTLPRRSPIVSRSERTLSQFVGRERELATLEELFAQVESGNGQVVGVVAEAGQGKSRLLYEFRQRLENKPVTYLEGRCLSYGSSIPYHPIIDLVRNNCGISEGDNAEAINEKVRTALQEVSMDVEASAPYLLRLLGVQEGTESIAQLTPEAVRTRTFETLRQMSLSGAQQRPLIFEVEDLHWQDKTSEDYMASLVESLPGASILLLTTYRPGYQPPWLGKSYATQISLHNLAPQDALAVVYSARPDETIPDELAQTIVTKAEGNPFFLEELTRAAIEHGDFQAEVIVPDTIQGVLSARIDRLSETHKRLLQTASVLGREFSPGLLGEIWDGADSLDSLLAELKRMEFLFERTGSNAPIYLFKHALTQDVAYESLLTTRRQALHAVAGQTLETIYAHHLEDAYDRLAYHYARADNAAKAVAYLTLVAEKAASGYAHAEAVSILQEALAQAERLPSEQRDHTILDLVIRQGEPLFWLGRRQELIELFIGQKRRLERLQTPAFEGPYYFWFGITYSYLGERERAADNAQQALVAARRCQDETTMGKAYQTLVAEGLFAGPYQDTISYAQQAISCLERIEERWWLGFSLFGLGLLYHLVGYFNLSLKTATRLETLAQAIGDRRLLSNAAQNKGWSFTAQGEWAGGIIACQEALTLSPDAYERAWALALLGFAYLENGEIAQGIPILEEAVEQAVLYRSRQVQSWVNTYLGEAYSRDNQYEKAQDFAHRGLSLGQDIKNPYGIGLAHRALGHIAQSHDNLMEAKHAYDAALQVFAASQVHYELARTHLDLASVAYTQNDHDTAATHLSTAYAWFKKLQVPKWAEKSEQLAQEYGVTLIEVELDDMTEGLS